jgi:hypothetical protein
MNEVPKELKPEVFKVLQHVSENRDDFDRNTYRCLLGLAGMKEDKKPKKNYVIETHVKCKCGCQTWIVKDPGDYIVHSECFQCSSLHNLIITSDQWKKIGKFVFVNCKS